MRVCSVSPTTLQEKGDEFLSNSLQPLERAFWRWFASWLEVHHSVYLSWPMSKLRFKELERPIFSWNIFLIKEKFSSQHWIMWLASGATFGLQFLCGIYAKAQGNENTVSRCLVRSSEPRSIWQAKVWLRYHYRADQNLTLLPTMVLR